MKVVPNALIALLILLLSFSFSSSYSNSFPPIIEKSITFDKEMHLSNTTGINDNNSIAKSRTQYFADGDVSSYFISLFKPYFQYSKISYLSAMLIFLLYLFYFRKIDIYEFEPWKNIIFTFLAGIFFADMGLILYDFNHVVLGFYMNDLVLNDLFYSIFIIGGIEEFVKIIPLLLLLRFTKIINEPIDYIVYGGVAALGFAFSENVMYFDRMGPSIVFGRALTAVVLHTSLTSIAAYGFVLRDYRNKKSAPFKMIFIAMIFHGLYDFFLINPTAKNLSILAYVILFASITIFNRIISNALSNSPYYNKSIHFEVHKIQRFLIAGLIGIFIIQFILISLVDSFAEAKESILPAVVFAIILIPTLANGFAKVELHPKKWKSIKIPFTFKKLMLDDEDTDLVSRYLQLNPMTRNRIMLDYFPNKGTIYKQSYDSKKQVWFYIKLARLGNSPKYNNKHIVLRSKFGNTLLNDTDAIGMAGVYLINKETNKPVFVGWCSVEELVSSLD